MTTWNKRADNVVHELDPYNAEPHTAALAQNHLTAINTFYSRNHGPIPDIGVAEWTTALTVPGAAPVELTFDELRSQFTTVTLAATLQCAGNRRRGFLEIRDIPGEDPWGPGATSTASWRGVRLGDVLRSTGVDVDVLGPGMHVAFTGPDISDIASPPQRYGSSIPLTKALSEETLLAFEMNDQPLPRIHGGPVRVVVPGFIGARSVKWVDSITVQDHPSDNYFQAVAYRVLAPDVDPSTAGPGDGISLSSVALNCDFLTPAQHSTVQPGPVTVHGYAFAGDDRSIERVEISADDGHTWAEAELHDENGPWVWRLWSAVIDIEPGRTDLLARAWDNTAATQPESAAQLWNPKGYVNNSWAHLNLNT
ncbi:sulfite oxidase [Rhodococcus sp. G-MC3]|uniref:sulfite oxidase n=1 Tax=Rhodococcus sp. G-MC3 TaxID=3046209 RepID=UPI0024BABEB4|nr:sulfite oxidase [Rhodococcus sp. G-MC3]MDJ0395633.1 sulfite oxidase [Rhodococcus sp. G-MC3]